MNILDRFSDNQEKFFELLGSGSPDEVPDVDEDDAAIEEEHARSVHIRMNHDML